MSQLGDQDDEDEIEEQLEKGHPTILGSVLEPGGRLP
jgi:hypothetical protein